MNNSSSRARVGPRVLMVAAVIFALIAAAGVVWVQVVGGFGGSTGAQAGSEDPATYRPEIIAPDVTDGFGAGDDIKEDFVLIIVPDDEVDNLRRNIPGAKL